jgi:hypothetical protein
MAPAKPRLQLGESWVVDDEDSWAEELDEVEPLLSRRATPGHRFPRTTKSPEPELVMPSLDGSGLYTPSSRIGPTSRDIRSKRSSKISEKPQESRRRNLRSSTTSEVESPPQKKSSSAKSVEAPHILDSCIHYATAFIAWAFEILFKALQILKAPIAYLLAVILFIGACALLRNAIITSFHSTLSPICRLPGASLLGLPFCPTGPSANNPSTPVEFEQLMTVQSKFEEVLESTAGGASLPLDMKRGEASIRDLRQLVSFSQLYSKYVIHHPSM